MKLLRWLQLAPVVLFVLVLGVLHLLFTFIEAVGRVGVDQVDRLFSGKRS